MNCFACSSLRWQSLLAMNVLLVELQLCVYLPLSLLTELISSLGFFPDWSQFPSHPCSFYIYMYQRTTCIPMVLGKSSHVGSRTSLFPMTFFICSRCLTPWTWRTMTFPANFENNAGYQNVNEALKWNVIFNNMDTLIRIFRMLMIIQ